MTAARTKAVTRGIARSMNLAIDWKGIGAIRVDQGKNWLMVQGDSQRILRGLPPEAFDAMITDPPYSSGGFVRADKNRATGDKYRKSDAKSVQTLTDFEGDNRDQRSFLKWAELWLWDARAALKKGSVGFVFADWRQLPVTSDAFQLGGFVWRGVFVWNKGGGARRAGYGRFSARCEYGVWGSNGPLVYETDAEAGKVAGLDILEGSFDCGPVKLSRRKHVTEKPVPLMAYVCRACPLGGIVLDPFAGVGSIGIGAVVAGRRFVGIELDPAAYDRACGRLAAYDRDSKVFESLGLE